LLAVRGFAPCLFIGVERFIMAPVASNSRKRGFTAVEAGEYIGRSASWLRKKRMHGHDDPGDPVLDF